MNPGAGETAPLLELRDVQAGYGPFRALFGVSLSVHEGSVLSLLGSNGAGKTTVARVCSGLIKPTAGKLFFDGEDVTGKRPYRLARKGIVQAPEGRSVFASLTVEENLLLPLELKGRLSRQQRDSALHLLGEVGLAGREESYPDQLSGGEQQRVAVARALAHDPLLVLADEPTGNLDLETGLQVLEILDRLTRRAGKTMVMVTHSPEVVGLADRVFRIEDCRLVERPAEVRSG